MENIEVRKVELEEIKHIFYCDNCKEKIGESIEYDDYYEKEGVYNQSFNVKGDHWYKLDLCLCNKCKDLYTKKIVEALINLGFTKE